MVLPLRVATLLARAWPFVGLEVAEAAALVSFEEGTPPDVVGRVVAVVVDRVPVAAPAVVDDEDEDGAGGCRGRVGAGSRVEDGLVRPDSAFVLEGGAEGGPPAAAAAAAASLGRVADVVPGVWRVEAGRLRSVDRGFALFFFAAAAAASDAPLFVLAALAPETLRVVGRVAARERGAGSLLGETGLWVDVVGGAGAAAAAAGAVVTVEVEVGGRSVEEPCVGFRSERVRARDEDMMGRGSCGRDVGWCSVQCLFFPAVVRESIETLYNQLGPCCAVGAVSRAEAGRTVRQSRSILGCSEAECVKSDAGPRC